MILSDENLRGRTAIASDGQVVGEVAALTIDSVTWRIEALQLVLRKEIADRIGADRGVFHAGALTVPVLMIQSVGDTVILTSDVESLRKFVPVTS